MPVNTAALKTFAPAMRRQLLEAVGRKLDLLLHQPSADTLTTAAGPIAELRQQEAHNRQELLERVAYSWFNRLAAREIPQLILEKNLFGLDIDERAAQLTRFALMMNGRGDDRHLFERDIQLNVMALVIND